MSDDSGSGRPNHPWSRWLRTAAAGEEVKLQRGKHFTCPVASMQAQAYAAASKQDVYLRTRIEGDTLVLRVTTRAARYPWDEWFDGQAHHLVYGADFRIPLEDMRAAARKAARRRGLFLSTGIRGNILRIRSRSEPLDSPGGDVEDPWIRQTLAAVAAREAAGSNALES